MRFRFLFSLSLTSILLIFPPLPAFGETALLHLTMEDGLSSNMVYDIQEDTLGFIWFLTSNGLDRYDGYNINNLIKFSRDTKISITRDMDMFRTDSSGNFWIGGFQNGLIKVDPYNLKTENYTSESDQPFTLGDNSITTMFLDSRGNLWVGTFMGGINLYSHQKKSFIFSKHLTGKSGNLINKSIKSIFEDRNHQIWAVDNTTLYKYNPIDSTFKNAKPLIEEGAIRKDDKPKNLDTQFITEDQKGDFWFYCLQGIIQYNPITGATVRYPMKQETDFVEKGVTTRIFVDSEGLFWLTFRNSLVKFDRRMQEYVHFKLNQREFTLLEERLLPEIVEDSFKTLWIGSTDGLILFNKIKHNFTDFQDLPDMEPLNAYIYINKIRLDNQHNFWFCTDNGIFKYNQKNKFISVKTILKDTQKTNYNQKLAVLKICQDSLGHLWIGTTDGLIKYDISNNNYKFIYTPEKIRFINFLYRDKEGNIWASTTKNLIRFNKATNDTTDFSSNFSGFFENKRWFIFKAEDISNDKILFGTRRGLISFDKITGNFKQYLVPDSIRNINSIYEFLSDENDLYCLNLSNNLIKYHTKSMRFDIFDLSKVKNLNFNFKKAYLDVDKILWIGTTKGLIHFNTKTHSLSAESIILADSNTLESETVSCICQDRIGNVWFNFSGYLIQYHVQKKNYQVHIEQRSDVNKDEILEIIEDSEGYLWILRKNGLSRFSKNKKYFTRYVNPETGDEFRNILMIPDGSFIIGSDFGIYHFHPDDIINRKIPRVVFTDFNVMNKPFPLDSSITFKKQITLTHDQNFFSLQFAALDYQDPNKNQYAYMLEGLDKDWIDNSNRHFASYSKVQPGTYMFRVKGSNSDGYWNEKGAAIKIVILPPWWQTSWARLSYALIAGLLIFGFWRFQTNRIRMKHQLEIEKLQAEKLQEIDRVKSHFFANISHEFRTPLTLILGPLESLRARISDSRTKQELNLIQRSAQRLYMLIGQLLDLSKLESGQMKLQAERMVLGNFLRPLILSFASWAEQKKITLQYQEPENPVEIYIDTEIIEKVVTNLLSNAMKFTPEGGRVSVKTEVFSDIQESSGDPVPEDKSQKFVTISVSDSGPGIPEDSIEHIFDRFYQAGNGYLNNQDGTGIGLALTRELVDRHYGKIRVESSPEKGSTFTVELPLGISHFREKEIIRKSDKSIQKPSKIVSLMTDISQSGEYSNQENDEYRLADIKKENNQRFQDQYKTPPLLLVVEDNNDLTLYMSNYLGENFRVITASNGMSGVQDTIKFLPDLIISDIMMPGMDGFELCRKIKTDSRTSHIPVILLTARADGESRLEGLDTGADDYITKPFDIQELQARVRNLIEQRRRLRDRFRRELTIEPSEITVTSLDEQFLQKAMDIMERHMSDSKFTTTHFSREIGTSRQHLNEKLHALTGQTTREFMRMIRLKRAAQLLNKKAGNVTEIAYETGFNNLSHFAKVFKEQFGVTPSDFTVRNKKQSPS